MKILYLCSVIILSCGVCASGDLEMYPGIELDFNDDESRNRLREYQRRNYFPFQNAKLDDFGNLKARRSSLPDYELYPERIVPAGKRHYREDVDWKQLKMRNYHKNRQHQDAFRSKYVLNEDGFPVFNEPRMYQPNVDSEEFDGDSEMLPEKMFRNDLRNILELHSIDGLPLKADEDVNEQDIVNDMHNIDKNMEDKSQSFSSGRFKDVETAEDPTDFAYVPPDPRFYSRYGATEKDNVPGREVRSEQSSSETTLKVDHRSELKGDRDPKAVHGRQETLTNGRQQQGVELIALQPGDTNVDTAEVYIIAVVAGISAAATVGLIAVGIGWYNLRKHVKNAQDVDYPAYGITGPNKDLSPSGDRRLAQSAQMYHYQHQKQQIIAMERAPPGERNGSVSDGESEEENEEGDYTVYECPGLAPTGEMEVKNPLFQDDPTPAQTPATKTVPDEKN